MLLISARGLSRTVGVRPLFEDLVIDLSDGERLAIIGPNGSGKSTLLRILAGVDQPDAGTVAAATGLRLALVTQMDQLANDATPLSHLTAAIVATGADHHEAESRAGVALAKAGFRDPEQTVGTLSGGWRKRLQVLAALVTEPQALLLDEPTNHLDLEGVLWLENLLSTAPFAVAVVSHDRAFIESVATSVVEVNPVHPGSTFRAVGGYSDFLEARSAAIAAQRRTEERLANTVTREIAWLRRNPKAQTCKAASRVQGAMERQDSLAELSWRNRQGGAADIAFAATNRRSTVLVGTRGLRLDVPDRTLASIEELDLGPGDRLGLLGRNGTGKSTLLRVLAGEIPAAAGTIRRAEGIRTAYFRQDRAGLDPQATLRRALCPNGETVVVGSRSYHVMGWAKRLQFRPEQMEEPVGSLSGGEQARLVIANLMTRAADVLLLDEPTNDLDIPTLEVLEEAILAFPGAVVLVTHDRALLDRVSNRLLALDGQGGVTWHADYWQWQKTQEEAIAEEARFAGAPSRGKAPAAKSGPGKNGLGKSERRELERIEEKIASAEAKVADLEMQMADPAVATDAAKLTSLHADQTTAQAEVDRLYARWQELEAKAAG